MSKRWLIASIILLVVAAAAVVLVVQRDAVRGLFQDRTSANSSDGPTSGGAEEGRQYRYEVGHCGLSHVVDFDGSFWDVDSSSMTEEEEARFGINSDVGTMTLTSGSVAVYRSSEGGEATLRRHSGPKTFFVCM